MKKSVETLLNERLDMASAELYRDPEFKEIHDKEKEMREFLLTTAKEERKKLLTRLFEYIFKREAIEDEKLYKKGFQDGISFCQEVMNDKTVKNIAGIMLFLGASASF